MIERVSVTEAGPGDYVKVRGVWREIKSNTAFDVRPVPRSWVIVTTGEETFGMYDVELYGKESESGHHRRTRLHPR